MGTREGGREAERGSQDLLSVCFPAGSVSVTPTVAVPSAEQLTTFLTLAGNFSLPASSDTPAQAGQRPLSRALISGVSPLSF